jgi:hypothetical protein
LHAVDTRAASPTSTKTQVATYSKSLGQLGWKKAIRRGH